MFFSMKKVSHWRLIKKPSSTPAETNWCIGLKKMISLWDKIPSPWKHSLISRGDIMKSILWLLSWVFVWHKLLFLPGKNKHWGVIAISDALQKITAWKGVCLPMWCPFYQSLDLCKVCLLLDKWRWRNFLHSWQAWRSQQFRNNFPTVPRNSEILRFFVQIYTKV